MHKNKKVIIGVLDVANQATLFQKGFIDLGYEAKTIILSKDKSKSFDVCINPGKSLFQKIFSRFILSYHFFKELYSTDIYLFQGGETFFLLKDLWLLRKLNKKVIMIHNGSETRYWPAYLQLKYLTNGKAPYIPSFNDLKEKQLESTLKRIIFSEKYANIIVSTKEINLFGSRDFIHFYVPFETGIEVKKGNNYKIQIRHSPSNTLIKGTFLIEQTIDRLIKEGFEIEYRRLENLSHVEVIRELAQTDIFIEQLGGVIHGKSSVEAMYMECIVLSDIDKKVIPQIKDVPIIAVDPSSIYEKLKEVLKAPQDYMHLGKEGRVYAKKYHSPFNVVQNYIQNLEDINDPFLRVEPFYIKNKFHADSELEQKIKRIRSKYA